MRAQITTLYDRGRKVPRWREGRPGTIGVLEIKEAFDQPTSRTRRTATLYDPSGVPIASVKPLLDATVLYVSADRMTITGIERLEDERTGMFEHEYAQSWAVIIMAERDQ